MYMIASILYISYRRCDAECLYGGAIHSQSIAHPAVPVGAFLRFYADTLVDTGIFCCAFFETMSSGHVC